MSIHTNGQAGPAVTTRHGDATATLPTPAQAGAGAGGPGPQARVAAARRRSRRGLLIAVLVVCLGGVLAFAGASMVTRHAQVLAVARDVPQGQVITDADLVVAAVSADPNLDPIPADQRGQVVGLVAQVPLLRGSLLIRAEVGASSGFTAGQQLVPLALKPGQLPARGLSPGEHVLVVATPGGNAPTDSSATAPPAPPVQAVVADVGQVSAATAVTVVDVRVAAADGPGLARLASTGNLAIIVLPPAGG